MDEKIFVPEMVNAVILVKHEFTKVAEACRNEPQFALTRHFEMSELSRNHSGLKATEEMLKAQKKIYDDAEKASNDKIKEIDRILEARETAFQEELTTFEEEKEETLRVEKAKYEQACQSVETEHEELIVQKKREKAYRERELTAQKQELQRQREQTQNEKISNLTLAEATLMAWNTGMELIGQYASWQSRRNDQVLVSEMHNNHQKLAQLQDYIPNNAMDSLKDFVWGSDVDL